MKKLLWGLFGVFLCLAFISPASALVMGASGVWADGIGNNGHEYQIVYFENGDSKKWEDAQVGLEGSGFTLAAITTEYEQVFVQEFLNKYANKTKKDLWIGGLQDPGADRADLGWSWVTEEKWGYESWIEDEANDYYGDNSEQFMSVRSGNFNWNWNDEGNLGNISGYLAETAPVPEPGTILLMGFGLLGIAAVGRKKFL